jgi:glycosyltransferase involved in cell wall biosynthesis
MRRLKVLWLSHFVPFPPKGGAFQRSYNLLRAVGGRHELHLVALQHKAGGHPAAERERATAELGRFCQSVTIIDGTAATRGPGLLARAARMALGTPLTVSVSNLPAMRQVIRTLVSEQQFDIAHFDTIGLACYLKEVGDLPAVLSHHGAESFMMLRRIRLERRCHRKMMFFLDGRLLRRYEARYCPRFADNFVVSDLDRQLLSEFAPTAKYTVVPNGVDTDYFYAMPPVASRKIVFAGRLDQYSNRDAIVHFVSTAWPGIRTKFPDATLDILGMNPPDELQALAARDPAVKVHGFVDDVRRYAHQDPR